MADAPINLNKARKAKEKAAHRAEAAGNRVRFGRTKAEKSKAKAEAGKIVRLLDAAKREP
jgi:hypothetical protein